MDVSYSRRHQLVGHVSSQRATIGTLALLLGALAGAAAHSGPCPLANFTGCTVRVPGQFSWTDRLLSKPYVTSNMVPSMTSAFACESICKATPGCAYFSYSPNELFNWDSSAPCGGTGFGLGTSHKCLLFKATACQGTPGVCEYENSDGVTDYGAPSSYHNWVSGGPCYPSPSPSPSPSASASPSPSPSRSPSPSPSPGRSPSPSPTSYAVECAACRGCQACPPKSKWCCPTDTQCTSTVPGSYACTSPYDPQAR